MNSIEVLLKGQQFEEVRIYVNQQLIAQERNCDSVRATFDGPLPANIDVEFWPFKIKPLVRYNNFLLDYWLANILLQDHKLSISVTDDFFDQYRNKNIQGRIDSLPEKQRNAKHFFDQYIGVNNGYPALVKRIKKIMD